MFLKRKKSSYISEQTKSIANELRVCLKEKLGLSNRDVSVTCKLVSRKKYRGKWVDRTEKILVIVIPEDITLYTKVKTIFEEFKRKYQSDNLLFDMFSKREYTMWDWGF